MEARCGRGREAREVCLSWDRSLPLSISLPLWSCWISQHRQNCCLIYLLPWANFAKWSTGCFAPTCDLYKLWLCQYTALNWQEITNDTKAGDQLDYVLDCSNSEISLLLLIATCFCWWQFFYQNLCTGMRQSAALWWGQRQWLKSETFPLTKPYPVESHHLIFNVVVIASKSKIIPVFVNWKTQKSAFADVR